MSSMRPVRDDPWRAFLVAGVWALAAALLVLGGAAHAKTPERGWRLLPWHLVDVDYRLPETGNFQSLEIELEMTGDVSPQSHLYISPLWGRLNGRGFYFGFLSNMYNPEKKRAIGKGLIFSRFGLAVNADARAAKHGWAVTGLEGKPGVGEFVSVRRPFKWSAGRYTFRLTRLPGSGSHTWLGLKVLDHASGKWRDGGDLRFSAKALTLATHVVSFLEFYRPRRAARDAIPHPVPVLDVRLTPPLINGTYSAVTARARFPKRVPRLVQAETGGFDVHLALRPPSTPLTR